ncbi:hypothetical protein BY996DRAFT_4563478, partial [Phakopsora pachyrhizi]
SSEGLIYKFDRVDAVPKTVEDKKEKLDGFIKQSCYPHPSDIDYEPMCIFLNPTFNNGRGAVFLTRPSVFKAGLKHITAFRADSTQIDPDSRVKVPFVVADMPHKGGKGAIADRKLHPADLVIKDHATIVVSVETRVWTRSDWHKIQKQAVDLLPLKTRAFFATLHGVGDKEEDWVASAIQRNAFETSVGPDDIPHFAVVPEPSRLNHDCRPNSSFWFDSDTLQVYMYALRDIAPGEELTISYRGMKSSRAERQSEIHHYGFECTCSLCSLPEYLVEVSDLRIETIIKLSDHLNNWNKDSPATPQMAERLIQLYKLERIDAGIVEAFTYASLAYNAIGNIEKAMEYAAIALDKGLITSGPNWDDREAVLKLVTRPTEHWSYNRR